MTNINEFILANNDLSGTIPSQLSRLGGVALSGNSLSGTLPTEMGNCGSSAFELDSNRLSGVIPTGEPNKNRPLCDDQLGNLIHTVLTRT
jgi:hypothetical protein